MSYCHKDAIYYIFFIPQAHFSAVFDYSSVLSLFLRPSYGCEAEFHFAGFHEFPAAGPDGASRAAAAVYHPQTPARPVCDGPPSALLTVLARSTLDCMLPVLLPLLFVLVRLTFGEDFPSYCIGDDG